VNKVFLLPDDTCGFALERQGNDLCQVTTVLDTSRTYAL